MSKTAKFLLASALAWLGPGVALANHVCAYANDNNLTASTLTGATNTVDGYNNTITARFGTTNVDTPAQIAVAGKLAVVGDFNLNNTTHVTAPGMGIFTAQTSGALASLNASGPLYPLTTSQYAVPEAVVAVTER